MTDKEKIRAEVEKRAKILSGTHAGRSSDALPMLEELLFFIDSMQEEPKTDWLQELQEKFDSLSKEDFEKVMAKYSRYGEEEPVSEDLEKELDRYIKDHFTIDVEQLDRFGIEESDYMYSMDKSDMFVLVEHFINWQKQKDSIVSEDLEEASKEWLEPQLDKSYSNYGEAKMMELTHFDGYAMFDAIEFGAKWKEQQLEKNRLARCDAQTEEEAEREQEFVMQHIKKYHCQPTFSDAIEWGMNRQREQMVKNAIEGEWWRCAVVLPAKYMNTDDIRSVKIIIIENN